MAQDSTATGPASFSNLEQAMDYLQRFNTDRMPEPDRAQVIDRYENLAETGISLTYTPSAKISSNPFDRPLRGSSYPRAPKESKPVLYVDGVQRDEAYAVNIPQEVIESINVVTDEQTMQEYGGNQGRGGMIIILTKRVYAEGDSTRFRFPLTNRQVIREWSGESMTKAELLADIASSWDNRENLAQAVVMIDGQRKDFEAFGQLEPADIYGLTILSAEGAASIYGDQGMHGALIIATTTLYPRR